MDPLNIVIIPSIINISCTFLCELFKGFHNNIRKKTIEKLVNQIIDQDMIDTIDSGSLDKFLKMYQTQTNFKNFILYSSYKKRIALRNFKFSLDRTNFLKEISQSAFDFVKNDSSTSLNRFTLDKYFEGILDIFEQKLIEDIPSEFIAIPYFINQRLEELENNILNNLSKDIQKRIPMYETIKINYLRILKSKYKKSHVYGYDLLELYSFYVFPKFGVKRSDKDLIQLRDIIEWENIFVNSNVISVIGGPGFGKTLFLHNLINSSEKLNIFDSINMLPIYCDLKLFVTFSTGKPNYSIIDYLVDSAIYTTGMDSSSIDKEFINYYINTGRCIILFDALDEVEIAERNRINSLMVNFFEGTNKNNKICLTSRDRGFVSETPVTYYVLPLDKEQIKEYLNKMILLGYFNKEDTTLFLEQCIPLIKNGFLTSFLVLSLLVKIFKAEKELPENKVDLYEKCIEYIAMKREKTQKKVKFDFSLMNSILDNDVSFEKLAYLSSPNNKDVNKSDIREFLSKVYNHSYPDKNTCLNAIEEFLRFCSERTELYVEGSSDNLYKFFHRSFFEFYYAKYLIKEKTSDYELWSELINFELSSEIYELVAALLKKKDYERYTRFLDYLLQIYIENKTISTFNLSKCDFLIKLSAMMQISNEASFLSEFYNICFNKDKILLDIDGNGIWQFLIPIVFRAESPQKILEDCKKYYYDEIIAAYFIDYIANHKAMPNIKIDLDFLFGAIKRHLAKTINLEENILFDCKERAKVVVNKYCEINDNNKSRKYKDINTIIDRCYSDLIK